MYSYINRHNYAYVCLKNTCTYIHIFMYNINALMHTYLSRSICIIALTFAAGLLPNVSLHVLELCSITVYLGNPVLPTTDIKIYYFT